MSAIKDFEKHFKKGAKNWKVYKVLKDQQWHCRECEYTHVGTTQIAGGGGIQGLERGTKSRPGMVIESGDHLCVKECNKKTRHDKWLGSFKSAVQSSSMPKAFVKRAISLLNSRDVVENTERSPNQLTIDHKLPMIRWNESTSEQQTAYSDMTDDDIRANFQLLKKSNGSVSHNMLKSRACEYCFKKGIRGNPFGIRFFYAGGKKWEPTDEKNPAGCVGCGWYDFQKWRDALNQFLKTHK